MSYFAQLNENNEVLQVISIDNSVIGEPEISFPETENLGVNFIVNTLGLSGVWKQTSYNNNFRKQYAGIGYTYDQENDVFVAPKPYPSWTLDENFDWQPPVEKPEGDYVWNEEEGAWEEI